MSLVLDHIVVRARKERSAQFELDALVKLDGLRARGSYRPSIDEDAFVCRVLKEVEVVVPSLTLHFLQIRLGRSRLGIDSHLVAVLRMPDEFFICVECTNHVSPRKVWRAQGR